MSTACLVIGESGTGKSASMRNMQPAETLLIQAVKKPLPFKSGNWTRISRDNPTGNILLTDNSIDIIKAMQKTRRKVIVLDDFQYILANEFMRRSDERGFDKFTDIGRHAWDILNAANTLPDDVRVYILAHSQSDDMGKTKLKTIGKLLDEKLTPEGLFTIVLRTVVNGDDYQFSTRNSGSDTVKTPMGMFDDQFIPNDLQAVDEAICAYFGITPMKEAA